MSNDRIQKTLRYSYTDGLFAAVMVGFTQDYFLPFLLKLGATARHVGLMSALPNLCAALLQLKSPDVTEKLKSRQKAILIFVGLQITALMIMAGIAFTGGTTPGVFIALVVCFAAAGAVMMPPWGSLMSDLIAPDKRGDYFGWRNRNLGVVTIIASLAGGLILHRMTEVNLFLGFAILFGAAGLCRTGSWLFLRAMHEPPIEHTKEDYFSFVQFLRRTKQSNFARFVVFVALMNFSVNVASPFFPVFMLQDLSMNYILFSIMNITVTVMVYLTIRRWGQHADKVGNIKVVKSIAPLIAFIPVIWILDRHTPTIIFAQMFSGFLWSGFNLAASNFIYDAVSPQKRTRCIAYFNVVNGLALSAGALVGGWLLPHLPPLFGHKILALFLFSSCLRIAVALTMSRPLKEVRTIHSVRSDQLFFSMIGVKPITGIDRKTIPYDETT